MVSPAQAKGKKKITPHAKSIDKFDRNPECVIYFTFWTGD